MMCIVLFIVVLLIGDRDARIRRRRSRMEGGDWAAGQRVCRSLSRLLAGQGTMKRRCADVLLKMAVELMSTSGRTGLMKLDR